MCRYVLLTTCLSLTVCRCFRPRIHSCMELGAIVLTKKNIHRRYLKTFIFFYIKKQNKLHKKFWYVSFIRQYSHSARKWNRPNIKQNIFHTKIIQQFLRKKKHFSCGSYLWKSASTRDVRDVVSISNYFVSQISNLDSFCFQNIGSQRISGFFVRDLSNL